MPENLFKGSSISVNKTSKLTKHYGTSRGVVPGLIYQPKLIVLNEPTAGLDLLMQHKFFKLIREENPRGATVFCSRILGFFGQVFVFRQICLAGQAANYGIGEFEAAFYLVPFQLGRERCLLSCAILLDALAASLIVTGKSESSAPCFTSWTWSAWRFPSRRSTSGVLKACTIGAVLSAGRPGRECC